MNETLRNICLESKSKIDAIRMDKELMNRIYVVTLGCALLILAVASGETKDQGRIINDDSGNAISIERSSLDKSENYDFEVEIDENTPITKDVNIKLHSAAGEENTAVYDAKSARESEIDAALASIINEIEYSKEELIELPGMLSDGTAIRWKSKYREDHSLILMIPAVYIALIVFVLRNSKEDERKAEEVKRKSILRGLPRFCNQLLLMMNAGMILSDAFEEICRTYSSDQRRDGASSDDASFERGLLAAFERDPEHRRSSASIISEFAAQNDVKEMIRIATILTENEKRGSDVIESLSRESRFLWDERKIVARESGKMIDTKMTYPLGILLILLIVITMAPAMLSM